ncbi:unnamed protein product [Alternaria alternata]
MFVKNSLCGYRESKKSDKYVVELATRAQDPEINDDFEENNSSAFDSDLEEETHERPLADKQRAKLDSKAARKARTTMDDAARQLATKLLDDHGRLYTEEDLDEDVHLARALKLTHSKKLGLPFDTVPGVRIKYKRFPDDMLEAMEEKLAIKDGAQPALMHILTGRRMEDFKEKSKKRVSGDLAQPETLKKRA